MYLKDTYTQCIYVFILNPDMGKIVVQTGLSSFSKTAGQGERKLWI